MILLPLPIYLREKEDDYSALSIHVEFETSKGNIRLARKATPCPLQGG